MDRILQRVIKTQLPALPWIVADEPTAKMLDWINSVGEDMVFDLAGDPNNLQAFNLTKKLDRK